METASYFQMINEFFTILFLEFFIQYRGFPYNVPRYIIWKIAKLENNIYFF